MPSATPPAAPGALVRRRLRDLLDLQQRRLVAQRVALDARKARVDDVADARHRERGLGDIGREHDRVVPATARTRAAAPEPRAARRAGGSRRSSRTAGARGSLRSRSAVSRISRSPGRKTRMSPGPCAPEILGGIDDRVLELLLVVGLLAARPERAVANVDREHPPGDLDRPAPARRARRSAARSGRRRSSPT